MAGRIWTVGCRLDTHVVIEMLKIVANFEFTRLAKT